MIDKLLIIQWLIGWFVYIITNWSKMQALYLDTALYLSRINELSTTKKKPVLQSDGEGEEEEVKVKEFIYFFTMIMILYPEQGCIFQTNFIILIKKLVNFPENSSPPPKFSE